MYLYSALNRHHSCLEIVHTKYKVWNRKIVFGKYRRSDEIRCQMNAAQVWPEFCWNSTSWTMSSKRNTCEYVAEKKERCAIFHGRVVFCPWICIRRTYITFYAESRQETHARSVTIAHQRRPLFLASDTCDVGCRWCLPRLPPLLPPTIYSNPIYTKFMLTALALAAAMQLWPQQLPSNIVVLPLAHRFVRFTFIYYSLIDRFTIDTWMCSTKE